MHADLLVRASALIMRKRELVFIIAAAAAAAAAVAQLQVWKNKQLSLLIVSILGQA